MDYRIIAPFGMALIIFGLSSTVYLRNKRSRVNISYGVFVALVALWSLGVSLFYYSSTTTSALLWADFLYFIGGTIPVFFFYFSLVFPTGQISLSRLKYSLIFLPTLIFFILYFFSDFIVEDAYINGRVRGLIYGPAHILFDVHFVLFFVLAFITLMKKYFKSDLMLKLQLRYMIIGTLLATVFASITNVVLPWFDDFTFFWIGPVLTIVWIGFVAYAIIRHRLLDIRLFVIRSILYTLTVVLVGGLFTIVVFTIGQNILGSTFWGVIIGSVIISLGLEPLLHFLRRITDEYFFQEKYNYQKTLKELAQSMTKIIDLENLLDTTTATIKSALKIEKIGIVLWNGEGDLPIEVKQVGFDIPLDTHFSRRKNLVQHLARTQDELVAGEMEIEMERGRLLVPMVKAQTIVREMRNMDIAVCFPIISNNELVGVLALGNKKSGDVFSNDDIELLNTFAYQASIAIVNAQLYREVKDFNITLQEEIALATEDLRKKNDELHRANVKLKELDQAKSDFLSLASHQLRAPLSITKGYVSMIMEGTYGPCPPEMIEPLEMVYNGNERLVKFVNNLLDVSRMESGRLEYIFKDVNLAEMAESVTKELKLAADKKKIYLKAEIDKSIPRVKADDEKLRQVVMNLIDNAIKYTKTGGVSVSLKKGKNKKNEEGIVFSVTDTGRGMDENDKVSLFQKFSRGKGISRVHTEGTGLGLFVAAKIIDAHKGTIWADSPGNDQGSMFAFWMPAE